MSYIGVDVGTRSVRCAIISSDGKVICHDSSDINVFSLTDQHIFEQSSEEIWTKCCNLIKGLLQKTTDVTIIGVGFTATCSLVVVDKTLSHVSVSPTREPHRNIIMWMDHRALSQTSAINSGQHRMLKYVGGSISVEQEPPKLLWLKHNIPDIWKMNEKYLFELGDFMTAKATAVTTNRSLCSVVCKWLYEATPSVHSWNADFYESIGLEHLLENGASSIGSNIQKPGEVFGILTEKSAGDMGLTAGIPVGVSLIDAHAGCLGCLSVESELFSIPLTNRLAMIAGTSACFMTLSDERYLIPGIWGPYYSVILPNFWVHEAGLSAAGQLIDHIIESHPAYALLVEKSSQKGQSIYEFLMNRLVKVASSSVHGGNSDLAYLTKNLHICPDFHGNRSPLADPSLRGMVVGLDLSTGIDNLSLLYLAVIQGLAYNVRHIIETLNSHGYDIKVVHICGGLACNQLYVQTHADITGLPFVLPEEKESVLLGAAMLGAAASKWSENTGNCLQHVMQKLSGKGSVIKPSKSLSNYHDRKYKVYKQMLRNQLEYREIMNN